MNPPYSDNQPGDGFYAKFLNKAIELTDTLISINPDPAVTGHQSGSIAKKEFSKFRNIMDTYYVEVDSINNDTFPDAHIKSGLCIVYLDKNKNHEIERYIDQVAGLKNDIDKRVAEAAVMISDIDRKDSDIRSMEGSITELFSKQYKFLDKMCSVYYETHGCGKDKDAIYKQVKTEIERLKYFML